MHHRKLLHRLVVLVLEHGRVKQLGTPEELLQKDGLFREIYQVQMAVGEEEPA